MNSNQSQGQRPQQQSGQANDTPVPADGSEGNVPNLGDSNRSPRQPPPAPGRPPQRQQGGDPWSRSFAEDADDEGDTRPNASVDDGSASRT
ncbi:hypothetical protein ACS5PN_16560 [Roseateles sp. NT4]|uniref:hypothetical protein n=1 Tax=Roseateles sp. NT4 TaxID=3453715 RepID=UPI003EEB7AAA